MTSMGNKRWDRESDARLIELWDQGLSIDGISEQFERTTTAVQCRKQAPSSQAAWRQVTVRSGYRRRQGLLDSRRRRTTPDVHGSAVRPRRRRPPAWPHGLGRRDPTEASVEAAVSESAGRRRREGPELHVLQDPVQVLVGRQPVVPALWYLREGDEGAVRLGCADPWTGRPIRRPSSRLRRRRSPVCLCLRRSDCRAIFPRRR